MKSQPADLEGLCQQEDVHYPKNSNREDDVGNALSPLLRESKSVNGGKTAALIWLGLVRRLAVRDGNDGEHRNALLKFGEDN